MCNQRPGQPPLAAGTYGHAGLELRGREDGDLPSGLAEAALQAVLHRLQQVVARLPLVLEAEAAVADVVQVLQPLEEGHGHATGVHVHVLPRAAHARRLLPRVNPRPRIDLGGSSPLCIQPLPTPALRDTLRLPGWLSPRAAESLTRDTSCDVAVCCWPNMTAGPAGDGQEPRGLPPLAAKNREGTEGKAAS